MRDSIDVSSHNSDVYGASCSSDESNAPTTKDIEAEMRRLNHLFGALGAVGVMKSSVCRGLMLSCGEVTCHAYFAVLIGTTCVLVSRN
ncbi:hypothetical protein DY000_02028920 [Brassica cretica]|uniref:Uncharacterized protein n=1 Tax=Brassica cretica TaxID=69181 RepID=A0ABQ7DH41_BRACR|nr:hypothetical protein DY000_02028920 [Brassica cretica]